MENTNRAEVTQSREDWLIGRLGKTYEYLQGLRMAMERNAVMNMAETYLCIEDTVQYLAEKRDEKKDAVETLDVDPKTGEDTDPAADEDDEDEGNG